MGPLAGGRRSAASAGPWVVGSPARPVVQQDLDEIHSPWEHCWRRVGDGRIVVEGPADGLRQSDEIRAAHVGGRPG